MRKTKVPTEKIEFLKLNYKNYSNKKLSEILAISIATIQGLVKKFKLNKNKSFLNQKFNKLTIINENIARKKKIKMVKCKCDCGREKIIALTYVIKNQTKSCGCIRKGCKKIRKIRPQKYGDISLAYWNLKKNNAKRRGLIFEFEIKDAWYLFLKQNKKCALSGVDLCFPSENGKWNGTASLDRIDSNKGYTIDNIQWIHKDLNRMKSNFPEEEFFNWINIIYNYKKK